MVAIKRFTETNKWEDSWFSELSPNEKLLWLYIVDKCDNAGFFEFNLKFCTFFTGLSKDDLLGAIKGLNRGLIGAKDGTTYYVRNFLRHQKNADLNPENNAHKQIIRLIDEKQHLFDEDLGAKQGLSSPTGKGKGKGIGKEESAYTQEFEAFWNLYPSKKGKLAASKSFTRAKAQCSVEKIMDAVTAQKQSDQWTRDNGKYIPNPATWLNQGRWDDETETVPKQREVTRLCF